MKTVSYNAQITFAATVFLANAHINKEFKNHTSVLLALAFLQVCDGVYSN